ncbi:MAG: 50S ribosomal protein L29 [Desulfovibrio sp.]|jgi:large subunit ribosomal protein L29|nr:50S ribosomal protein L29 [Desulfovibrio sp.]
MASKNKSEKFVRIPFVDLRVLSAEDLRGKVAAGRRDLMDVRMKHSVAQFEKTSEIKALRRHVARMLTILNEKQQRS